MVGCGSNQAVTAGLRSRDHTIGKLFLQAGIFSGKK
jgi:hypothetical protein